jgi:hypothetical protein
MGEEIASYPCPGQTIAKAAFEYLVNTTIPLGTAQSWRGT